ncbi:MAG: HsdM family class I SAM-dependent methyltransferase [Candidatus Hodarchaeales archaeon]|jgi:type I restriction-modification system DNA methylase subunit
MTLELPVVIEKTFKSIINSIPINFSEKLTIDNHKQLSSFSELTDIPLDLLDTLRQLVALLILNRLRFIALYGEGPLNRKTIYATYQIISDLLKQAYPKIFISSILDSIANLSTLVISPSLLQFDQTFLSQSIETMSSLYLEVLDQKFRRKMGQFWTPRHIAEFMIELLLENNPRNILDPCTGPGTFIHTLQKISPDYRGKISAIELHPLLYEISKVNLYNSPYQTELIHGDFLTTHTNSFFHSIHDFLASISPRSLDSYLQSKSNGFDAIICNPPYSRHHQISSKIKNEVGYEIEKFFGGKFNRISSLFMYFILKSLKLLTVNGRMVFITPTISFESRNSDYLKKVLKRFRVPFIIVFHHSLNVFPGVDTAACIFTIEGRKPEPVDITKLLIVKKWTSKEKILNYLKIESNEVFRWTDGELHNKKQIELDPKQNWTRPEAFSMNKKNDKLVRLETFFRVMRGIATGNNNFFTLNDEELVNHKIDQTHVVPTIAKTRYVQKYVFSETDFNNLRREGRNVWLLNIQQELNNIQDQDLLDYLKYGLEQNVQEGSLVKTRKYWFTTEKREIPHFLFTYLSRGNPRFIQNEAQVRPLNSFLMIYPKKNKKLSERILTLFWVILNSNTTFFSLRNTGRCYGGNTLKIEPREMMNALILNPFKISADSKNKLIILSQELREINTANNKEIIGKIDAILEDELKH